MASRIGLLGGTFDPPHLGHLVAAEVARVRLALDEVRFVVAGQPWMKDTCSPADNRVAMVELAIADNPAFVVDRSEIDREGPTYTVDTLQALSAERADAELYFLAGADAVAKLPHWRDPDKVLELATFVALTRPGYRLALDGPVLGRVERIEVPGIDISSTDLRRRFQRGDPVRYQLPAAVEAYVRRAGLYDAAGQPAPPRSAP